MSAARDYADINQPDESNRMANKMNRPQFKLPRCLWRVGGMALWWLAGFGATMAGAQTTSSNAPVQLPGRFPPPTEDSSRPPGITQSPGRPNSWSDAQGRSYVRSGVGTWTSYDESKANPYPLPDPLVLKNGQPVKDASIWWNQRRPEILEDFRAQMYGRIPDHTPKVTWEVTATITNAAGGKAIKRSVVGHIDNSRYPGANPSLNLTLFTPANAAGPVPMMVVVEAGPGGYGAPRPGTPAGSAIRPLGVRSISSWPSVGATARWKSAPFKTTTAAD